MNERRWGISLGFYENNHRKFLKVAGITETKQISNFFNESVEYGRFYSLSL